MYYLQAFEMGGDKIAQGHFCMGTVGPQLDIAKKKLEFLFENLWVESQDSRAFNASN